MLQADDERLREAPGIVVAAKTEQAVLQRYRHPVGAGHGQVSHLLPDEHWRVGDAGGIDALVISLAAAVGRGDGGKIASSCHEQVVFRDSGKAGRDTLLDAFFVGGKARHLFERHRLRRLRLQVGRSDDTHQCDWAQEIIDKLYHGTKDISNVLQGNPAAFTRLARVKGCHA